MQFLYPYARFVYHSITDFLMGNNVIIMPIIILYPFKFMMMLLCWVFSPFIAPLGLLYLYFYHSKNEKNWFQKSILGRFLLCRFWSFWIIYPYGNFRNSVVYFGRNFDFNIKKKYFSKDFNNTFFANFTFSFDIWNFCSWRNVKNEFCGTHLRYDKANQCQ